MKLLIVPIAVVGAAMLASGCSQAVSANQTGNVSQSGGVSDISYTVESGIQNGIPNQQLRVIMSDTQFAALVSVAGFLSGNLPSVDYSKNELVAVFLGANAGCGTDELSVDKVDESNGTVTVHVTRTIHVPPAGQACTWAPLAGRHYALLTMPKTSEPVSLQFTAVTKST